LILWAAPLLLNSDNNTNSYRGKHRMLYGAGSARPTKWRPMNEISSPKQIVAEPLSYLKLRHLAAYLQKTREEERARIAREIHDELGQLLATVQMGMSLMAEEYRDHQKLSAKISDFDQLLREAVKTVQRISADLRPQMLDTLGLGDAMDWQAQEFQKRTGIDCTLKLLLQREHFDPEVATAIFRIFQETLTNVIRHAGATRVLTTLQEKRNRLILIVRDNGRGITPGQSRDSHALGIMGMRERAYALGGRLRIFAAAEQGTIVMARIPVTSKEKGKPPHGKNTHC
jgi:signal transduction histidine kinase